MKVVEAADTVITNKVRAVFQHPSSYTTVLHKEDNHLYLYEQRHMRVIGTSQGMLCSAIELLAFSNNFNVFYVVCKEVNHPRQLTAFELNELGELAGESMEFRKSITVVEPQYLCMTAVQTKDEEGKDTEILLCLDARTYSFVTKIGRIVKQQDFLIEGQTIKANKIRYLKEEKFVICSENTLFTANIDFERCELRQELKLQEKIRDLFLDSSKGYMGVHTCNHKMHVINYFGNKFRVCFDFPTQSLNISDACFFTLGANTSATNKFKDRLYLVFQVISNDPEKLKERAAKRNADFGHTTANYSPNNLYVYQFRESLGNKNQQYSTIKAVSQFCVQGVGKIRALFFSKLDYNCILALSDNKYIYCNLVRLLGHARLDKEWIYLSYKFESCISEKSVLYEQRENQFEREQFRQRQRQISEEELNDWSASAISAMQIKNFKKHRIKCLNF